MKKTIRILAALSLAGIVFAFSVLTDWKIGKEYNISFSSKDVRGVFEKFSATIVFDEADLPGSQFNLIIEVASLNTGIDMQTEHARSAEWFDAGKYPLIKFTSSVIDTSGNGYVATGTMEMHGIRKEIGIPFSFVKNGENGVFSASFIINRNDYKVGPPGGGIAEDIKVEVKVPVTKSK